MILRFLPKEPLLLLLFAGVLISLYLSAHRALMTTLGYGRENAALLEKLLASEQSVSDAVREQETVFETSSIGLALVSKGRISTIARMQTVRHSREHKQ